MRTSQAPRQTLKFQQYFQDEDINLDDYLYEQVPLVQSQGQSSSKYDQSDQIPIQLVQKKNNGQFAVNTDAVNLIASYNKPIALVCLAGKYRTGKSFLLNKLMGLKGRGFKVSSSTDACTEGIWMWSRPIYNQKQNCLMFVIDTQGSEATNRNAQHDAKIFTIAILISSYFIYNSVGAIDEPSINELNLVATLSKGIASSGNISQQSLHRYMPKFVWLLRDFILETRDQQGRQLSPIQYLQSCLDHNKGSQQSKNTKKALTTVFKYRDCMMLIRPADNQDDLKNLDLIPDSRLRPQFLQGVNTLRNKILGNASPKIVNGQPLTTQMIGPMITKFVDTINKGAVPNILSAWQQIGQDAALQAYDAGLQAYNQKFDYYFSSDKAKQDELLAVILRQMRDAALDAYDYNVQTPNQKIRNKLKIFIEDKQKTIYLINDQYNESNNIRLLAQYSQDLIQNVEAGKYSSQNSDKLNYDLKRVITRYNANAQGNKKCQVLSLFLTNFNAMIFKSYNDTNQSKINLRNIQGQQDLKMHQDYMQQIRILQGRLDSVAQQQRVKDDRIARELNDERRKAQQARNEVISVRKQMEALANKKKKTKCCFF